MDALVLASPDAAIAAVPHILGFVPENSLVLVWCDDGRIVLTQRMDLVEDAGPAWMDEAVRHGVAIDAEGVIAIAFRSRVEGDELPGRALMDGLERRLAEDDVELVDALLVDEDRWWSYRCDDICCPEDGRVVDPVIAEEVVAGFVLQGSAPFSSRRALVASLEPEDGGRVEASGRPEGVPLEAWRDGLLAGPIATLLEGVGCSDAEASAVIGGLADVRVRDTLLWHLTRHEDPRLMLGRLSSLLRCASPGSVAPIATVTGVAAWLCGDGARASIAVERALQDDAGYSLALLVDGALRSGLGPTAWLAVMRELPRDDCRHGMERRRASGAENEPPTVEPPAS